MNKIIYLLLLTVVGCQSSIKNENPSVIIEEGVDTSSISKIDSLEAEINLNTPKEFKDYLGYWVGEFRPNIIEDKLQKEIIINEGTYWYWSRKNKITISIDYINDSIVIGHSVVAGNERPFEGTVIDENGIINIVAKEPGDDKYDGKFTFQFINKKLEGTWEAFKNIDIKKREYSLEKKEYHYNQDQMLLVDGPDYFIDWDKYKVEIETYGDGEDMEEYENYQFATTTDKIYDINASNTKLKKEDVENLSKGDLKIIRNTIYARHGYSFKNRPMRVFFDAQDWYIPTTADIKADFTKIEKDNIDLLLKYEKNAEEYYDSFGR